MGEIGAPKMEPSRCEGTGFDEFPAMVPKPMSKDLTLLLQPGERIRADVLRDRGDGSWVLGLLGVEVAFPSLVPLQVGSTITLLVEVSLEGASVLRLVEDPGGSSTKGRTQKPSTPGSRIDLRA